MTKASIKSIGLSVVHSYSQIFFSDGKLLGLALLLVSFFNFTAGLSGIVAIGATHITAYLLGLNRTKIINGIYGFNSLLVGLGLGIYYQLNWQLMLLVVFSAVLTLFVTVVLEAILSKYGLPFLSLPFLFGIWTVSLAARHYGALEVSEQGVYVYNDIVLLGGNDLLQSHFSFLSLRIPASLNLYFISLGAIFFQYNVYAGIIIAIVLLLNSRISFLLSLLGFYSAYWYYQIIGANLGDLNYGYIGFNFILTAIAIGGYFIIPSIYSFVVIVLLIPVLSLLVSGSSEVLSQFQLSTFSLPFNIVVISFLLVLKYREHFFRKPELVIYQHFSPEKNLYTNLNFYRRFGDSAQIPISLPFYGEWSINQGHNGEYTHKEDWQYAWDFVIEENGLEYDNEGNEPEDYYCYNKAIVAPADGEIVEIVDLYDDNIIGEIDMVHNWGNTIVIKHAQYLYSQVSHIKKGSFKVYKGQHVRKGEIVASVGNSGRSPVPHLHFQLQATPFVGSKTMRYTIGPYVINKRDKFTFVANGIPNQGEQLSNIKTDTSLRKAFRFIPGMEINWELVDSDLDNKSMATNIHWTVGVDLYNQSYLYSKETNSYAYFKLNEQELIFTSYVGSKEDPLYLFFLTSYRLIFGYYKDIVVSDDIPITLSKTRFAKVIQDFVAPFYIFIRPKFSMQYLSRKQFLDESEIHLKAKYTEVIWHKVVHKVEAEFSCASSDNTYWKLIIDGNEYRYRRK